MFGKTPCVSHCFGIYYGLGASKIRQFDNDAANDPGVETQHSWCELGLSARYFWCSRRNFNQKFESVKLLSICLSESREDDLWRPTMFV